MIIKRFVEELAKYNAAEWIAERLLVYGKPPFVKWLIFKYVDGKDVYRSFDALSIWLGVTVDQIRNAYYSKDRVLEYDEVRSRPGYDTIILALLKICPNEILWDSLLRFGFNQVRQFAVELAVLERGHDMKKICDEFKISQSLAYRIRRTAIKRFIERQKDDFKFIG